MNRAPLIIALVAATGGLILICLFAYLLWSGDGLPDLTRDGRPTPTAFVPTLPAVFDSNLVSVQIGDAETVNLTVDAPTFLQVGGINYSVQREIVSEGGLWSPSVASETTAVWINGTVINYIFALADTQTNRTLMESLTPGAQLSLVTKEGQTHRFEFDARSIVPVTNRDIFAQTSPGLTVVLVGLGAASSDRMVVRARYVIDEMLETGGAGESAGPTTALLGEPTTLGSLELTATLFDNRPSQTGGLGYFLIDYTLRNGGNVALDTRVLQFVLVDDAGNQYALNAEASLLGNRPPLGNVIAPGEQVQATVGFRVPGGLDAAVLAWRVTRTDSGATAEFRSSPPGSGSAANPETLNISLFAAELSPDAGSLLMQGQIANLGAQPVLITQNDVTLISNGAVYLLLSTSPAFPWVISPGQTIPYAVAVQRPINADSAVFTILNQSFELTGLR